jgi:glycosyltransferase involved in cell wall biosynthesis
MEAMATGCLVLGSDTAPVREVVSDGENGFLVDHLAPDAIADRVADLVAARHRLGAVRQAARDTVLERYDLAKCLPRQLALIRDLAGSGG